MKYPPHPLTRKQVVSLIEAAQRSRCGNREAAHLTVLYRTGMRCAESCNLDMDDLRDFKGGCMVVRVTHPKGWERGAMPREIGLDVKASQVLRAWLAERGPEAGPVFQTRRGRGHRVQPSHIRRLIPQLAKQAGITRRVHPHALRHTFARELYDEGVGPVEIMLALGHTNLATTQKYLRSIGATEVIKVTASRGW